MGVFPNPILPLVTDTEESLDKLAGAAAEAGAYHFGGGILFLMPSAQKVFFPFLEQHFPELLPRYRKRYEKSPYIRGEYLNLIRDRVQKIRARHGLSARPRPHVPPLWEGEEQPALFPLH